MYSGRAERGRAGLHVDVRGEAAVDDRRARVDRLGQDHPGERLGVLLGQRAGERDRRHRPGQRERRDAHDLVVGANSMIPWSIGASSRSGELELTTVKTDGSRSMVRGVHAARDADHLEHVDVALATEAVAVDRLVHQGQRVERRVQVADAVVEVDRLDRVAGQEMDGVERLAEPQQVLVVGAVADPPAAVEVRRRSGGLPTVPNATQSPPSWRSCAGLRAWSVNSPAPSGSAR